MIETFSRSHREPLKTGPAHSRGWSVLSRHKVSISWNLVCVPNWSKLSVGWQNKNFVSISFYEILNWESNLFPIFLLSKNTCRCTRKGYFHHFHSYRRADLKDLYCSLKIFAQTGRQKALRPVHQVSVSVYSLFWGLWIPEKDLHIVSTLYFRYILL